MQWKLPAIRITPDLLYPGAWPWLTNSFFLTIVSAVIIFLIFWIAARKPQQVPGRLQNFIEWAFELMLNLCKEVSGEVNGRRFFPWVMTIFLLALIGNWWEVIPGIETIGLKSTDVAGCAGVNSAGIWLTGPFSNCITPFLRPPSTDLSFTVALSIISVVITQVYGFKLLGPRVQIGRYIILNEGPIGFVVGLLEFFLEILRVLSLSFRLFGNIFAGDVLLLVMGFISIGIGAVPFYFLELFVGFIQAFVIAFLTLLFLELGTTPHEHEDTQEHQTAETVHEAHARAERALGTGAPEPIPAR
ncbi:MAG: F0F1 ATP synthase subunit A [Ktedonobacterales bacterium]